MCVEGYWVRLSQNINHTATLLSMNSVPALWLEYIGNINIFNIPFTMLQQ